MIEPYFKERDFTLYLGDTLEILNQFEDTLEILNQFEDTLEILNQFEDTKFDLIYFYFQQF